MKLKSLNKLEEFSDLQEGQQIHRNQHDQPLHVLPGQKKTKVNNVTNIPLHTFVLEIGLIVNIAKLQKLYCGFMVHFQQLVKNIWAAIWDLHDLILVKNVTWITTNGTLCELCSLQFSFWVPSCIKPVVHKATWICVVLSKSMQWIFRYQPVDFNSCWRDLCALLQKQAPNTNGQPISAAWKVDHPKQILVQARNLAEMGLLYITISPLGSHLPTSMCPKMIT